MLSRVKSFLPELQKSNESLPEHVATCVEIEEIGDLQTKPESGFTESDSGSHEEVSSTNVPKVNSCGSPTLEDDPSTNFKTEMNVDKFKNEDPNRHVEMVRVTNHNYRFVKIDASEQLIFFFFFFFPCNIYCPQLFFFFFGKLVHCNAAIVLFIWQFILSFLRNQTNKHKPTSLGSKREV